MEKNQLKQFSEVNVNTPHIGSSFDDFLAKESLLEEATTVAMKRVIAWSIRREANDMKCPACGAAELVHDTRDVPYTYKGKTTSIPSVTGDYCPACAEIILDMAEADRYGELVGEFHKQVNAADVDPVHHVKAPEK